MKSVLDISFLKLQSCKIVKWIEIGSTVPIDYNTSINFPSMAKLMLWLYSVVAFLYRKPQCYYVYHIEEIFSLN